MAPKLSDTQLVILSAACQRSDGAVYPLTVKLSGGAANKVLTSLLNKGLIKEVRAGREDTVWRHENDRPLTLCATRAAFQALGIDQGEAPAETETAGDTAAQKPPRRSTRSRKAAEGMPKPRRQRGDSKQAQLITMLKRPEGATIEEIVAAFGWQAHTVRGAIAGALKKKLGLDVTSEKVDGRGRVYRIAG
jgi:hypothetical protein